MGGHWPDAASAIVFRMETGERLTALRHLTSNNNSCDSGLNLLASSSETELTMILPRLA